MTKPLADLLRPKDLKDIFGQDHLLGEHGFLSQMIKAKRPLSILLWGPPGCGKTSLAKLYAKAFEMHFEALSAAANNLSDVKKVVADAKNRPLLFQGTLLFLDEIHRFNKAQQDALLPHVEDGTITLVGATTENPSFYLNDALLSRMRVLEMHALSSEALEKILSRYEKEHTPLLLEDDARQKLLAIAHGDGRYLLNMVESLQSVSEKEKINSEQLELLVQQRAALFDRGGDNHYNLISALHKSIRGSDPDAALYWLARILDGGEEPLFIARRLIRMATEDIGLADPQALTLAIAAKESFKMLGNPEGVLALAEVTLYLALAPKSNAVYTAFSKAQEAASKTRHLSPPKTILNAPTKLMKQMDYGKGYCYDHDTPLGFSGQQYFPEQMEREEFYHPVERGYEREMVKRKNYFSQLRTTQAFYSDSKR